MWGTVGRVKSRRAAHTSSAAATRMSTTSDPQTRSPDVLRSPDMLREAIARNCGVVLSLPSAGMLRHHRSRFLAEAVPESDPAAPSNSFWLESVPSERPLLDELVASQKPVGVSFKGVGGKVVFASPIVRREPG